MNNCAYKCLPIQNSIQVLNESVASLQSITDRSEMHYDQLHNTDNLILEVDAKFSGLEEEVNAVKEKMKDLQLTEIQTEGNDAETRQKVVELMHDQVDEIETRFRENMKFLLTEINNLVQHIGQMESQDRGMNLFIFIFLFPRMRRRTS